jgi:hypothetical protein
MGKIDDFRKMWSENRIGFVMEEVMSGEHRFEPGFGDPAPRPMEFRVTWGPKELKDWINWRGDKFMWQELHGTVSIDGLCDNAPCDGTLELKYFSEHILRYTFTFTAKGKEYRFVGEKVNIQPWNLPVSHTTCYGVLTEAKTGKLVSKSVTHFRLSTTPAFLGSFRFA